MIISESNKVAPCCSSLAAAAAESGAQCACAGPSEARRAQKTF